MSRDKQTEIEKMRNDVQEALKHNSAVDAIRHGLICVNSDGVARELFDDGYRKASDVAEEIFAEIDTLIVRRMIADSPFIDDRLIRDITKLRKKYIGKDTNVTTKESEKDDG